MEGAINNNIMSSKNRCLSRWLIYTPWYDSNSH